MLEVRFRQHVMTEITRAQDRYNLTEFRWMVEHHGAWEQRRAFSLTRGIRHIASSASGSCRHLTLASSLLCVFHGSWIYSRPMKSRSRKEIDTSWVSTAGVSGASFPGSAAMDC